MVGLEFVFETSLIADHDNSYSMLIIENILLSCFF